MPTGRPGRAPRRPSQAPSRRMRRRGHSLRRLPGVQHEGPQQPEPRRELARRRQLLDDPPWLVGSELGR